MGRRNDGVVAVVPTDPPPVENLKFVEFARAGPVPVKLRIVFDVDVLDEKRAGMIVWLVVVGLLHSWLLQGTLTVLVW